MLIEAGPPPELPPELEEVPDGRAGAKAEREPTGLPRRRVGAALALAAAIALIAFVGGYLAGYKHTGNTFESVRSVALTNDQAQAVVRFGPRDGNGNTPMLLKVEGLKKLSDGDYYTLYMTTDGKPVVVCGSFNVRGPRSTTRASRSRTTPRTSTGSRSRAGTTVTTRPCPWSARSFSQGAVRSFATNAAYVTGMRSARKTSHASA